VVEEEAFFRWQGLLLQYPSICNVYLQTKSMEMKGKGFTSVGNRGVRNASLMAVLLVFFACSADKTPEKTIDFDTLSHASDYDETAGDSADTAPVNWYDSLAPYNKQLLDSLQFPEPVLSRLDTTLFPDRFGALTSQKFLVQQNDQEIAISTWDFKDSLKTKTAFYNWLDCFGLACKSIRVEEEVKLNAKHTAILVYAQKLVYLESNKALDLKKIILVPPSKKASKIPAKPLYIVFQPKGKKASWLKLDEKGELVK
jgi:hypothetical protein